MNSKNSFIFNLSNNKLIGIHKNNSKYYNKGIFFKLIINEFIYEYKNQDLINEIIITMNINKIEFKKKEKIRFLGDYEFKDEKGNKHLNENLKDLIITELKINGKKVDNNEKSFIPEKIGENIIKIKYKNNIKDYSYFFAGCKEITSVNFVSLNNKEIINMKYMFYNCEI